MIQPQSLSVLDPSSDVTTVGMNSSIDDLKKKLEILLGEKAPAPTDMSMLDTLSEGKENGSSLDRERASEASGKMLTSVFSFIKEALPETSSKEGKENPLARALQDSFKTISNIEPDGKVKMQLTFESQEALDTLSGAIAMLLDVSAKR